MNARVVLDELNVGDGAGRVAGADRGRLHLQPLAALLVLVLVRHTHSQSAQQADAVGETERDHAALRARDREAADRADGGRSWLCRLSACKRKTRGEIGKVGGGGGGVALDGARRPRGDETMAECGPMGDDAEDGHVVRLEGYDEQRRLTRQRGARLRPGERDGRDLIERVEKRVHAPLDIALVAVE